MIKYYKTYVSKKTFKQFLRKQIDLCHRILFRKLNLKINIRVKKVTLFVVLKNFAKFMKIKIRNLTMILFKYKIIIYIVNHFFQTRSQNKIK